VATSKVLAPVHRWARAISNAGLAPRPAKSGRGDAGKLRAASPRLRNASMDLGAGEDTRLDSLNAGLYASYATWAGSANAVLRGERVTSRPNWNSIGSKTRATAIRGFEIRAGAASNCAHLDRTEPAPVVIDVSCPTNGPWAARCAGKTAAVDGRARPAYRHDRRLECVRLCVDVFARNSATATNGLRVGYDEVRVAMKAPHHRRFAGGRIGPSSRRPVRRKSRRESRHGRPGGSRGRARALLTDKFAKRVPGCTPGFPLPRHLHPRAALQPATQVALQSRELPAFVFMRVRWARNSRRRPAVSFSLRHRLRDLRIDNPTRVRDVPSAHGEDRRGYWRYRSRNERSWEQTRRSYSRSVAGLTPTRRRPRRCRWVTTATLEQRRSRGLDRRVPLREVKVLVSRHYVFDVLVRKQQPAAIRGMDGKKGQHGDARQQDAMA